MMTLRLSLALEIDNLLCTARVSWLTRFCWQIISSIKEFVVFKLSQNSQPMILLLYYGGLWVVLYCTWGALGSVYFLYAAFSSAQCFLLSYHLLLPWNLYKVTKSATLNMKR